MSSANGTRAGSCSTIWRCWLGTTEPAAGGRGFCLHTLARILELCAHTPSLPCLPGCQQDASQEKNQQAEQTQMPSRYKIKFV